MKLLSVHQLNYYTALKHMENVQAQLEHIMSELPNHYTPVQRAVIEDHWKEELKYAEAERRLIASEEFLIAWYTETHNEQDLYEEYRTKRAELITKAASPDIANHIEYRG